MAGAEKRAVFLFVFACLAVVLSVNGYCFDDTDCSPGVCDYSNRCLCPEGYEYTGSSCSASTTTVSCNPACQNGGTCHKPYSFSTAHCDCPSGYTGSYCETRACSPACQNGGTCHRLTTTAHCDCPSGYTGSYCQSRVCSPSCQNGGTCHSGTCYCTSHYEGSYCQYYSYSSSGCSPACENGGTCNNFGNCHCASGYTGSYCQYPSSSSSSSSSSIGYVFGGVFGAVIFISCIVGVTVLRVCLRMSATRRRSANVEAARVAPISAGIGRRVIVVQRVCRAPPTNPNAPPPYVPSNGLQSSDPPPYSANPVNCPLPISVEDTPTQPLPQEVLPTAPSGEYPPEYLPAPGSEQEERQPLMTAEQ